MQSVAAAAPPRSNSARDGKVTRWFASVDGLRGFAAAAVCLHHLHGDFWRWQETVLNGAAGNFFHAHPLGAILSYPLGAFGFLGVHLFFVVSGFCIHMPQAGKTQPLDGKTFALRRALRIYPLYLVTFLVSMFLAHFRGGEAAESATLPNFLGHFVFWYHNGLGASKDFGSPPVLWTIAVEVQFYIIYALLLPVLRRIGIGRATLIAMIVDVLYRVGWQVLETSHPHMSSLLAPVRFAPIRFGEWMLGAWIAESLVRGSAQPLWKLLSRHGVMIGSLIIATDIAITILMGSGREGMDIPAILGFAAILAGVAGRETVATTAPPSIGSRIRAWLGMRSYSLYLVHYPVMLVTVDLFARTMGAHTRAEKDQLAGTPLMLAAVIVAGIAMLVATAIAYRLIEGPSHRLARTLSARIRKSGGHAA